MGMHSFSARRLRSLPLLIVLGLTVPAAASDVASSPPVNSAAAQKVSQATQSKGSSGAAPVQPGWLYKGSDITPDPDWHFGTLPNGLRYALRKNGVPPGQVAVRIRIDAGSLYEKESERGFAHLIEHLSFRSSAYVADSEAKRIWQRLGTTFGSDTNAQTGFTGTTYKLDLPSATEQGLDESLHILSGMMAQPLITPATLNAERPVVLAEQREQPGAQSRFADALRSTFFAGQPIAERSPIGTIKTLEAATADKVKAFHDRWYRPERAVVIVVGDLDPALFEKLVAKNFADWKGIGANPADPDFGAPKLTAKPVRAVAEPSIPAIASYAVLRPWTYRDDTIIFNQKRMVDMLALRIINRRLETRARSGGSFISANVNLDDVSRSANGTFVQVLPIGDDWASALKDVRAVIADAQAKAASQQEIDREVGEYDRALKTQVDTAAAEAGAKQADDLDQALDIRETVTTAQTAYDIFLGAKAKGMFTPAAILASTKAVFIGTATHAIVNTRNPDPTAVAKLQATLNADVSKLATARSAAGKIDFSMLPKLGAPATIVSRTPISDLGMEQVVFSNGVRMMLFANPSEAGRVYVRVRFGRGYNDLPADKPSAAWAAPLALVSSGIGTLGQEELDALTSGRRIDLDLAVDDDAFVLGSTTSAEDLPDQLTLIAAKLASPGWDPKPVARARALQVTAYAGYSASPGSVLGRDLEGLLHAGDPRWGVPPLAQVTATTPAQFRALWAPLLQSGPIEVQVFGDVKADDAIAAVAKSIGALAPRAPSTTPPPPIAFPKHVASPVMRTHDGPANQAVAVIAWPTGGGIEGISDSRRLDLLAQVFTDRLFDRLRSEAGASYSPSVSSRWPVGLSSGGRVLAVGQVPPDKVAFFFKLAREIAADLAAKPIDADELKRAVVPYMQLISRTATGNTFWFSQLEGATYDDRRIAAIRTLARDVAQTTPELLQATAQKYLRPEADWTMAVVPKAAAPKVAPKAGAKPAGRQPVRRR
ncbi:MAG: insulinase family protein [Sphingomonas sp.]|nr:insulinase family protein [Sphingomonas sp.]